jgi:hypothetical protein
MSSLQNLQISQTFPGLIKTNDEAAIDGTLRTLQDGAGNDLPIEVSTTGVNFTGTVTGIPATGVTSIIAGTNVTIDQATGDVTISASGGGGGSFTRSFGEGLVGWCTRTNGSMTPVGGADSSSFYPFLLRQGMKFSNFNYGVNTVFPAGTTFGASIWSTQLFAETVNRSTNGLYIMKDKLADFFTGASGQTRFDNSVAITEWEAPYDGVYYIEFKLEGPPSTGMLYGGGNNIGSTTLNGLLISEGRLPQTQSATSRPIYNWYMPTIDVPTSFPNTVYAGANPTASNVTFLWLKNIAS